MNPIFIGVAWFLTAGLFHFHDDVWLLGLGIWTLIGILLEWRER